MIMHFPPSLINSFIHPYTFLHFSSHQFFLSSKNTYLSLQRTRTLTIFYDSTVRARITVLHSAPLKGKRFSILLFTSSRIILLYPPNYYFRRNTWMKSGDQMHTFYLSIDIFGNCNSCFTDIVFHNVNRQYSIP